MKDSSEKTVTTDEYDLILVGSGTGGCSLVKELSRYQGLKILVLEQGKNLLLKDNIKGIMSVAKEYKVEQGLKALCAATAGGSTSVYFGVCKMPGPESYEKLGIDFSEELDEVMQDLPLAELPDSLLAPQTLRFGEASDKAGYPMGKKLMIIDQNKCDSGYNYAAKWKAKDYLDEAVESGVELKTQSSVNKILVENHCAVGVEYTQKESIFSKRVFKAYAKKIVIAAGAFNTPKLLIDAGIADIGSNGFFCTPGFMVFGYVPGLNGQDGFLGALERSVDERVTIGDATTTSSFYKLVMLGEGKLNYLFSHPNMVSAGMLLSDTLGGEITPDGKFKKQFLSEEYESLKKSESVARLIMEKAGSTKTFKTKLVSGIPGGFLKIGIHIDRNLQTELKNLYVCDHSIIADSKSTPTVPLVCLGKYLSKHLQAELIQPTATAGLKQQAIAY